MMLKTYLGVIEDESGLHYLRPETAQGIFINFANVVTSSRKKPPFGIAQMGKSFRNEITPGNFIFRTREFEQMEMEYFVKPGEDEEWHQYWIDERTRWFTDLGISSDNLRHYEHPQEKLSHYSKRTVDIEYNFGFSERGFEELEGIANRTDFDLTQHSEYSGQDLSYFDQASGERYIPYVIEPALGPNRAMMAFLMDAYTEDEAPNTKGGVDKRVVLKLDPRLAPDQGRRAAAEPQRRPQPQGQGPRRRAARPRLERRLRRLRRDRPPLPPPGRGRHAVLRDGRLRHPRRPRGHHPRAGHHEAGAHLPRPGDVVLRRAPGRVLRRLSTHSAAASRRPRCSPLLHCGRRLRRRGPRATGGGTSAASGGDATPGSGPAPYLPVPDGVVLTDPGSELGLGEQATVAWRPRQGDVGVLNVKVRKLVKADIKDLQEWQLDAGAAPRRSTT